MPLYGLRDRDGTRIPWNRKEIASSAHWRHGQDLLRRATDLIVTYERFATFERRKVVIAALIFVLNVVAVAINRSSWWCLINVACALWEIRIMLKWSRLWHESVRSARDIRGIRTSVATKMAGYTPESERN